MTEEKNNPSWVTPRGTEVDVSQLTVRQMAKLKKEKGLNFEPEVSWIKSGKPIVNIT